MTDARFVSQKHRRCGVFFQLEPQSAHRDTQIFDVLRASFAPYGPKQLRVRHDAIRMPSQFSEHGIFLARELQLSSVARHAPCGQVDGDRSDREDAAVASKIRSVPEPCSVSCQQFVGVEWLDDIIVRAEIERRDLFGGSIACGQDDTRAAHRFDKRYEFNAVTIRDAEVEKD